MAAVRRVRTVESWLSSLPERLYADSSNLFFDAGDTFSVKGPPLGGCQKRGVRYSVDMYFPPPLAESNKACLF
jgi:hypothetical protein